MSSNMSSVAAATEEAAANVNVMTTATMNELTVNIVQAGEGISEVSENIAQSS